MRTLFSVSADFRELLPVVESRGQFGGDQHEKQDSGAGGEQDKAKGQIILLPMNTVPVAECGKEPAGWGLH
ncbi:hypothetical protein G5714_011488 [Onychostoma macrolepis]|uniref:Uncharacterized protein n=1 Tax=Onychostoma macrolepis TaxID=369639 RepID=A0A7J6CJ09_9TELE|nr:hypothetical protein G5714_011488 [Onychostoma macrolepis]